MTNVDTEELSPAMPGGTVVVVDDDPVAIDEFTQAMCPYPGVSVDGYLRFDDRFRHAVLRPEVVGVSADWVMYTVDKGPDIITYVKTCAPQVATMVSTRFAEKEPQARSCGIDFFRVRHARNELPSTVGKMSRLTYRRRISAYVDEIGNQLGTRTRRVDTRVSDSELLEGARTALFAKLTATGFMHAPLRDVLVRRGWWRQFSVNQYAALPFAAKAQTLAEIVGIDLAALGPLSSELTAPDPGEETACPVFGPLEELVAIVGRALRLVQYEVELLPAFFAPETDLQLGGVGPPWSPVGLGPYLQRMGSSGIDVSYKWLMEA